jgi:hypothetical protein
MHLSGSVSRDSFVFLVGYYVYHLRGPPIKRKQTMYPSLYLCPPSFHKSITDVYRFLNIFIQFYDAVTLATPAMQIVIRLELIIIIIIIIIIILILIIIILT